MSMVFDLVRFFACGNAIVIASVVSNAVIFSLKQPPIVETTTNRNIRLSGHWCKESIGAAHNAYEYKYCSGCYRRR